MNGQCWAITTKHGIVKVSTGNMKLGMIPQINLTPVLSCASDVPCSKKCYAVKVSRYSTYACKAYADNLAILRADCDGFLNAIDRFLEATWPRWFRFHSSGDFDSVDYFYGCLELARNYPDIKFLAFTKRYEWAVKAACDGDISENFSMVLSAWPSLPLPKDRGGLSVAWMRPRQGTDPRIPSKGIPESCTVSSCRRIRRR